MASIKFIAGLLLLAVLGACAVMAAQGYDKKDGATVTSFRNLYAVPEDKGERPAPTYFFRRA